MTKEKGFHTFQKEILCVVTTLCLLTSLQMVKAETVNLVFNTDRCVFDQKIVMDRCKAIYRICDNKTKPTFSKVSMEYIDTKKVSSFSNVDQEIISTKDIGGFCMDVTIEATKNPWIDVDNVLCYDGVCNYKWAWWNASHANKLPFYCYAPYSNVDITNAMMLLSNSTSNEGMLIGSSLERSWGIIPVVNSSWRICANVYYNDTTDYLLVDETDTTLLDMFIDEGNSTDQGTPEKDLVAWYRFSDVLNNGTDSSIYGNDLTVLEGTPVRIAGKIGHGMDFNGASRYSVAHDSSQLPTTGITLMAWVYADPISLNHGIIAKRGAQIPYFLWLEDGTDTIAFYMKNDGGTNFYLQANTYQLFNQIWYHVTATYNGTNAFIYINGLQNATVASAIGFNTVSTDPLYIADEAGSASWDGILDDVRIYNRTLSAYEILLYYNNTIGTHNVSQFSPSETNVTPPVVVPPAPPVLEPQMIIFWDARPTGLLTAIWDIFTGNNRLVKGVIAYIGSLVVSGNVDIEENLNVTGNISGNSFYGEMWNHTDFDDGGYLFPIASDDVYYNLTNLTIGRNNGFEFTNTFQPNGGSYLTARIPGIYEASLSVSFSGGNTKTYEIGIAKNFDELDGCQGYRTGSAGVGSLSAGCFMSLDAGDTVNIIIENEDTNQDATIYYVNLNLLRIGD